MITSNLLKEHYNNQDVFEVIFKHSKLKTNYRLLCAGHKGWYRYEDQHPRIRSVLDDYSDSIRFLLKNKKRSLYWTLNFVKRRSIGKKCCKDLKTKKWKMPITYDDLYGISLGVDIDLISQTTVEDKNTRHILEKASQYLCDRLNDLTDNRCVSYFSGNGIYLLLKVSVFDELREAYPNKTPRELMKWFNSWIANEQNRLYKLSPETREVVKIDALNHKNRVFKTLLSFHKKLDFTCIPLDVSKIKVDLKKAQLPLSEKIIKESLDWGGVVG